MTEEDRLVVTTEKLSQTLNKLANIAVGFNWKHEAPIQLAFSSANTTLVTHCYYLKVPHTVEVDRLIRESLLKATSIYYTRTGKLREHPVGDQEVDFSGDIFKLT